MNTQWEIQHSIDRIEQIKKRQTRRGKQIAKLKQENAEYYTDHTYNKIIRLADRQLDDDSLIVVWKKRLEKLRNIAK